MDNGQYGFMYTPATPQGTRTSTVKLIPGILICLPHHRTR